MSNSQYTDVFVLLRSNKIQGEYYCLRRQKKTINSVVKEKCKDNEFTIILKFPFCPNAIMLNREINVKLKKLDIADIDRNDIILEDDCSEEELIEVHNEIYNQRIIKM